MNMLIDIYCHFYNNSPFKRTHSVDALSNWLKKDVCYYF